MREIKFRGKRYDSEKWIYGNLVDDDVILTRGCLCVDDDYIGFEDDWSSVKPETVGQFTGLLDKNGKEIYEGDIVLCLSKTDKAEMVVIFEDGEFRMVLTEKYHVYTTGFGFYAIRNFDKEVIGNIHDNPELAEGIEL